MKLDYDNKFLRFLIENFLEQLSKFQCSGNSIWNKLYPNPVQLATQLGRSNHMHHIKT